MNKKMLLLVVAVFLAVSVYCADKPDSGNAPAAAAPAAPGGPTIVKGIVAGLDFNGKTSDLLIELQKNEKGWRDTIKVKIGGAVLVKNNVLQKNNSCINSGDAVVVETVSTSTQVATTKPLIGKTMITKVTTKTTVYLGQNALDYPNVKYKDGKNN